MIGQQDSVGLVTFDTKVRKYIPPRSRVSHLRVLMDELQRSEPGGETEIGDVFHDLVPKLHRRGLLIILSDLFGDVPALLKALAHFRHAHHEILVFQIWDPRRARVSLQELDAVRVARAGRREASARPGAAARRRISRISRNSATELTRGCRRHKIDLVPFTTDQPYAEALAAYMSRRARG